jgi:hypothetical protein
VLHYINHQHGNRMPKDASDSISGWQKGPNDEVCDDCPQRTFYEWSTKVFPSVRHLALPCGDLNFAEEFESFRFPEVFEKFCFPLGGDVTQR